MSSKLALSKTQTLPKPLAQIGICQVTYAPAPSQTKVLDEHHVTSSRNGAHLSFLFDHCSLLPRLPSPCFSSLILFSYHFSSLSFLFIVFRLLSTFCSQEATEAKKTIHKKGARKTNAIEDRIRDHKKERSNKQTKKGSF